MAFGKIEKIKGNTTHPNEVHYLSFTGGVKSKQKCMQYEPHSTEVPKCACVKCFTASMLRPLADRKKTQFLFFLSMHLFWCVIELIMI